MRFPFPKKPGVYGYVDDGSHPASRPDSSGGTGQAPSSRPLMERPFGLGEAPSRADRRRR